MAGDDHEMFTLNVTPNTTKQHLIVHRDKCSLRTIRYDGVYLTCSKKLTGSQLSLPHGVINNRVRSTYCTIEANY